MSRRHGAPGSLKVGDVIGGKYRVERLLGEGGMGMVVAAHHVVLDQPVAVKLLHSDDQEAISRLVLEAKSAARIPGEHVSRVLDIDQGQDGRPFIVMELLDGLDLHQALSAQGPLPRWVVVDYMLQALLGLAGAHARGIVHRDLKPSNLFLARRADGSSIIKVLDFGVSKSTRSSDEDLRLTGAKAMLGSPPYMSPEQVRSPKTVDTRADIWALGIVMFELLTGRLPFQGQEVQETFAAILEREPPNLRELAPEVPAGLVAVVRKCLAKNRDERFQTVHELAAALVAFGSGTWTQAAEEVRKTLARPLPDDSVPASRSKPGPLVSTREVDVQPTASTVIGKRRFTLASDHGRSPLLIAGVSGLAMALFVIAAFIHHRHRAQVAVAETNVEVAPPVAAPPMVPGVAGGSVGAGGASAPLAQTGQAALPLVQVGEPSGATSDADAGVQPGAVSLEFPAQTGVASPPGAQPAQLPLPPPRAPLPRKVKVPFPAREKPTSAARGTSLPAELLDQK